MAEMPDVPPDLVIGAEAPAPSADPAPSTPAPVADTPASPEPAPSATAAVPSTPSPSSPANPDGEQKFEIKVDGKVELLTRAEVIALAQQGKSFTQKTQSLADERRRWEAERSAVLQQERDAAVRKFQQDQVRAAEDAKKDPATKALERVETLEQNLEDQRLESILNPLLTKYGVEEQQFLIEASRQGLRSAADVAAHGEAIAKALSESQNSRFEARFNEALTKGEHPKLKELLAKNLADYLAKKGNPGPAPLPTGGAPALGTAPRKARSFEEAADIAEEMLTGVAPRN